MNASFYTDKLYKHQGVFDQLVDGPPNRRVQQSFIFAGPDGIGKKTTALRFARHLLCDRDTRGGCGSCASCRYFDTPWNWHPDLFLFQRFDEVLLIPREKLASELVTAGQSFAASVEQLVEGQWLTGFAPCGSQGRGLAGFSLVRDYIFDKSGQKVAASGNKLEKELESVAKHGLQLPDLLQHIYSSLSPYAYSGSLKVDTIRQFLVQKAVERPFLSQRKVFILDGADNMTVEAQNSLLKTLEEPPAYTVIILVTSMRNKLLSTIRSRCRTVMFAPLELTELSGLINELTHTGEAESRFRAVVGQGNALKAVLLDQDTFRAQRQSVVSILQRLSMYSPQDLLQDSAFLTRALSPLEDDPHSFSSFEVMETLLLDIMHLQQDKQNCALVNEDIATDLAALARNFTLADIEFIAGALQDVHRRHKSNVVSQWNVSLFLRQIMLYFREKRSAKE